MSKDYVFCTKCGARNSRKSKFCVQCGARLVTNPAMNDQPKSNAAGEPQFNSSLGQSQSTSDQSWMWGLLTVLVIIVLSIVGYQNYQKQQRADIRSYVYNELSKSEFKVKINQDNQSVVIVPESSEAQYLMRYIANFEADSDDADDMDGSIKAISQKIDKEEGDGWTVSLQNPDNSKRFFWIYKDGKAKYRLQDHAVSYDDYDDYGDDYDFDDD